MRIGIFSNCYQPMVNGVVGAVSLLRKGFSEAGHQVYIFTPRFDDFVDLEPEIYRYPAVDLTKAVKYPVAVPFSPRITRVLRDLKLDIIHTHHPFVLGPVSLRIARRQQIPVVYTFHTQYDQYSHYIPLPERLVKWSARHQVRRFSQAAHRITTPADSARQILIEYGVTKPIQVIPNPTDLASLNSGQGSRIRDQYQLTTEKLLINVGRVAPEKNLSLLLKAFRLMLDQAPAKELKLMILGDGPELPRLTREAAELGISEAVIFCGVVPPAQVPDYLAAADLFVMTSTSEVKPLAQLEALAAGLPIAAVAAAGANDTISNGINGLLLPEDATPIAKAVLELVKDSRRLQEMARNARKTAIRYDYTTISREYLEFFTATIKEYQLNGGKRDATF